MSKKTVVVALGGNALLKRSEPMTAEAQRANVKIACKALAPLAETYNLVIAHGNGPQVGLLALQAAAYTAVEPYSLDVLGAQTQGMIAYMVEQELGNLLPFEKPLATVLTMVEVDPADPAFSDPTKFVGPCYDEAQADELAAAKGWIFKRDGASWRRVVASPKPKHIFELAPIRWLMEKGTVVICAGGGGIPTVYLPDGTRTLVGIEAVIDKDLAGELLAEKLDADIFVMATDAEGVYLNWGRPEQELLGWVAPEELSGHEFAAGSMGPKVEAAIQFARSAPGRRAAIGRLEDISRIVEGEVGTNVVSVQSPR
ncbi:MAG: carbamate kinase [Actinobacteria bacterium HGW-Actinobacteria-7]|nr:MAG: carbamate kinase [Actinobacteria bacterium HGW-Actinobacteria-7]